MNKAKSLALRVGHIPFWVWLLPVLLLLGRSHLQDIEKQRAQQRWDVRYQAVKVQVAQTEKELVAYKAAAKVLTGKVATAKARGGATAQQKRDFGNEMQALKGQLARFERESKKSRTMLDKLQQDKADGRFGQG